MVLALIFLCIATGSAGSAFRFSTVHGDGMVLQSAPQQAVVWGFTPFEDDKVTVLFNGAKIDAIVAVYGGNYTWRATLPATKSSLTATYNITASSKAGKAVAVTDVLFGVRDTTCYVKSLMR
jgi:hypothetical protein